MREISDNPPSNVNFTASMGLSEKQQSKNMGRKSSEITA